MDEPLQAPVVPTVSVSPKHSWLHRPTDRTLLIASGVLALVVSAIMLVAYLPFISFIFATHGTRFEVVQNGTPSWYEVTWQGTAIPVSGPKGYERAPVTVLEAVLFDSAVGDVAVLAKVQGSEGVVLGILHSDNTFSAVVADGTPKTDLAVRPDGIALYSVWVGGESHIKQISLAATGATAKDLGQGRDTRLFSDGFFVAISDRGIVRIDPATTTIDVLLPNSFVYSSSGALSNNAGEVVMPGATGKTTLLKVVSTSPSNISVVQEGTMLLPKNSEFIGNTYIVSLDKNNHLRVYSTNKRNMFIGVLNVT